MTSLLEFGPSGWVGAYLLDRRKIDHRRHAPVRATFMQLDIFLDDGNVVKTAEGLHQHCAGVEILDLLGASGAVLQLLWRIALDDDPSAALERPLHAGPFLR